MLFAYSAVVLIAFFSQSNEEGTVTPGLYRFACFVQVITAIGVSGVLILSHKLKTLHFTVIQFNYALISTILFGTLFIV